MSETSMALANELIQETIRRALRAPFYSDLYRTSRVDIDAVVDTDSLSSLPIVDKELLRNAGASALSDPETKGFSHLQHTSGTTGEPFFVHRSMAEAQFIEDLFTRLNTAAV